MVSQDTHAAETFAPPPRSQRKGVALCLSGGGFRAALFHLGALTRLNELGMLSKVDTISSVSGGSILSGHLSSRALPWPEPGASVPGWKDKVVKPFHDFVGRNIRNGPILKRLLPWNWLRAQTAVEALADIYQEHLTDLTLDSLPDRPRFIFCATDMNFGVAEVFDSEVIDGVRGSFGNYQAGYLRPMPDWPIARAVAASSCFPPVFNPLQIGLDGLDLRDGLYQQPDRAKLTASAELSDGGVYDNLGLEPVWKTHETVMVSDGGAVFEAGSGGFIWQVQRYTSIANRQGGAVRKRWLISNFLSGQMHGAYWGIGSDVDHYRRGAVGYSGELVEQVIARVRTDLDAFSPAEQMVLENHGYLLADVATNSHLEPMLPANPPPASVPYPEAMDETWVRKELKDSAKRKLLGRR